MNEMKWRIQSHYWTYLTPFLSQDRLGRKKGSYIYYVRNPEGENVYVGQTKQGVLVRLTAHFNDPINSHFGMWILQRDRTSEHTLHIISIVGSLDSAERFYINELNPFLNKRRYKTLSFLSPDNSIEPEYIDIGKTISNIIEKEQREAREWADRTIGPAQIDPVHDTWHFSGFQSVVDLRPNDQKRSRVFRDPNHPDLRNRQ